MADDTPVTSGATDLGPDNPQDVQTPGTTEPDEPGEIGWPADAKKPHDPSVPEKGAGGPASSEPGPPTHPNDQTPMADGRTVEEVVATEPAPYAEWSEDDLRAEINNRRAAGETLPDVTDASKAQMVAALESEDASRPDAVFVEDGKTKKK